MNSKLFAGIIAFIILLILNLEKVRENMEDCSSKELKLEDNPLLIELKNLSKKYEIIIDYTFQNFNQDDKIKLKDKTTHYNFYIDLNRLLNSYRVYNPIYDIVIDSMTSLGDLKNEILKIIILNHLNCYGEKDVELFWIRLHLLDKNIKYDNNIETFKPIEPFSEKIFEDDNLLGTDVISYEKHKQNIVVLMLNKYPDLVSRLIDNYTLDSEEKLRNITDKMLDYLINLDKNNLTSEQKTNLQTNISNLYQDLRELVLIDRIMKVRPNNQYSFSDDGKTFKINHKILLENNELLEKKIKNKYNNFVELFESLIISKKEPIVRNLFFQKLVVYLKYHNIKIDSEYPLLKINSITLEKLPNLKDNKNEINKFAENLHDLYFHKVKTNKNINIDKVFDILGIDSNIQLTNNNDNYINKLSNNENIPLRYRNIYWIDNITK